MSDLDPEFLELADVFELHADSIARYGGDLGVRDRGLIESAVAVPRQSFGGEYLHTTLFEMAAAYAFHIAESQGFVDGNKRAGLAAATAFLAMNGYDLIERDERLYTAMIAISARTLDKRGLAGVFEECSQPIREEST
ncbi:MAG TPA: type II toxin-antitoxin system death-on-curing family toxin [Polyangia bacterium]